MAGSGPISIQPTTVVARPYSGDYRVDVLLENPSVRWNASQPPGSPVEVTYSFMTAVPDYASPLDAIGFSTLTDAQKAAVRQVFLDIAQVIGITFKEVPDTANSYGQIRFANNAQGLASAGYAFYPDSSQGPNAGDVYINNEDATNLSDLTPGSYGYATLVHEIGHALGLKHPGNYDIDANAAPGNYLAASEDTEANSIMSIVGVPQGQQRGFYGPYDLLAMQYLYGARPYNTGTNTYSLGDSAGQNLQLLIDTGGVDTLDASAATAAASIDLREGKSSSIGRLANGVPARSDVQIAFGTVIENAVGTSGNDTIAGNGAANAITGGGGNDSIDGGTGVDTAVVSGNKSGYTAVLGVTGWTIADSTSGRDGTDALANVERLKFADGYVVLDLAGNAGTVAKILGTVFGSAFVANKQFVGIGLGLVDGGMSYQDVMTLALDARLGAGYTNDAEVRLLYQNVIGTVPGESDVAAFSGLITSGQLTQVSLAILAADTSINTGNIKLTGLATTALEYTPYP